MRLKKLLSVALAALFMVYGSFAVADTVGIPGRFHPDQNVLVAINVNNTADFVKWQYMTDDDKGILTSNQRVLGVSVCPLAAYSTVVLGMYDCTTQPTDDSALECEIEEVASKSKEFYFPYPYQIENGIGIMHGEYTMVMILYENK